jgi:glutamine synthetase
LPAALKFQTELAQNIAAVKAVGASPTTKVFDEVGKLIGDVEKSLASVEVELSHESPGVFAEAKHLKEKVIPALGSLRTAVDSLETLVSDELWPLPTYQELLFVR